MIAGEGGPRASSVPFRSPRKGGASSDAVHHCATMIGCTTRLVGLVLSSISDRRVTGMINFEIYVQEGCVSGGTRPALESALESVCGDVLSPEAGPVMFTWIVIAKGYGFRGGIPSTTSLVRSRIPDGCVRSTRERFLRSIGAEWCRLTKCAHDEVLVSARDWSWEG